MAGAATTKKVGPMDGVSPIKKMDGTTIWGSSLTKESGETKRKGTSGWRSNKKETNLDGLQTLRK